MNTFDWNHGFPIEFQLDNGFSKEAETTKRYLSQMADMFYDKEAARVLLKKEDPLIYEFYELAFGLVLSIARKIPSLCRKTAVGEWVRSTGMELAGKTMGIIGLGAIGKVVARCANGFSMQVLAYDPFMDEIYAHEHHIIPAGLAGLLEASDVISLHLPLTPETHHYINAKAISQMKDGVILINASRGGILDEEAILPALDSGKLGGLGLDAFEKEPPVDSPLLAYDNVIATPHTGAHTKEATEQMAKLAVQNLLDVLEKKDCPYLVN